MKMSFLTKYYVDKSYIVDKHDPNHDRRRILHTLISKIWWFWTPKRVTRVTRRLPKNTPFYAFFWSRMCTMSYLTGPPGEISWRYIITELPYYMFINIIICSWFRPNKMFSTTNIWFSRCFNNSKWILYGIKRARQL